MHADEHPSNNPARGSGLYLLMGIVAVALIVSGYVLLGTPGLHEQIANPPGGGQAIDAPDAT